MYKVFFCLTFLFWGTIHKTYCFELESVDVKIGGCLRFNYRYNSWSIDSKKQFGSLLYDVFRLNLDASYHNLQFHTEYRFYSKSNGGPMLKNGWIGYNFSSKSNVKFGHIPVPFGILPYQSNSYFFNLNYYLGLEDDDDFGLSYHYSGDKWHLSTAFFKNADIFNSESAVVSDERYSYDIAGKSKEINTFALRGAYKNGEKLKYEIGLSTIVGGIYNIDTKNKDVRYAGAIHAVLSWNYFDFKTQFTYFDNSCEESENIGYITMTAFNAPYQVFDKGQTYSFCLSYMIPFNHKIFDNIKFYNDYSLLKKSRNGFNSSQMNVLGCSISMGHVFVYVDAVCAKNQAWFGSDWNNSFAKGGDNKLHTAFNVNVGYYF